MDSAVQNAIVAVRLDDEISQERWFEFVCATYDKVAEAEQPDWHQFTALLTEMVASASLPSDMVEQFVQHMAATDLVPLETLAQLRERSTELPVLYREFARKAASSGDAAEHGYDESAWNAFLTEHGAYWNGADASWSEFTTWFHYQAGQHNLADPAREFTTYAENQPDKTAVFAQYGIPITEAAAAGEGSASDPSGFPEVKQGHSGEWVDYLDTMLTSNGF